MTDDENYPSYFDETYSDENVEQMEKEFCLCGIIDPEFDEEFDDIPFDYPCIYFPTQTDEGE